MKKYLLLSILFISLISCRKDCNYKSDKIKSNNNSILMLKVDFSTYAFEGGKKTEFSTNISCDSIPVVEYVQSPGDIGSSLLKFIPTDDSLFFGSIIWMGVGSMIYPSDMSMDFTEGDCSASLPSASQFQHIGNYTKDIIDSSKYEKIWATISKLEVMSEYNSQSKIGIYLYVSSVGPGDASEWDWFVFFFK